MIPVWEEFKKNTIKYILFICFIVIGYLYIDYKSSTKNEKKLYIEIINKNIKKIEQLESKLDSLGHINVKLYNQLRKSDSALASITSKLEILLKK